MTPAILIDVDGVLNPDLRTAWEGTDGDNFREAGWAIVKDFIVNDRPLWLNRTHGIRLMHAALAVHADLVWATRWHESANQIIGPLLGLPQLEVIYFRPDRPKAHAVIPWAGSRRFAWLDDEEVDRAHKNGLYVNVDEFTGLTEDHIARARDWLAGKEGSDVSQEENRSGVKASC